jgi:hypothetical protein
LKPAIKKNDFLQLRQECAENVLKDTIKKAEDGAGQEKKQVAELSTSQPVER